MAGRIPPFTLDDFKLAPAKRAEITDGLSERQTFMVNQWMNLHDKLNVGDWSGFDEFMNDLGTFEEWNTSPRALFDTFPPSVYRTLKAWGKGDDEICVLCHHHGKHSGGPYMGVAPTGNQLDVLWFSWIKFDGDKIVHIYSISDVLSMLIDLEVMKAPQPVDPYK
jgi:SnoaL-like polyketide cyclase